MLNDCSPSLIGITYCSPKNTQKFKDFLSKNKFRFREIKLWDITIDLNKYDSQINLLKHFIRADYWGTRNPLLKNNFIINQFLKQIEKTGFTPIKINTQSFKYDISHPLINTLFCPLFMQDQKATCTTKEELKNNENLKTLKTEGYKPDLSLICKNQEDVGEWKNVD